MIVTSGKTFSSPLLITHNRTHKEVYRLNYKYNKFSVYVAARYCNALLYNVIVLTETVWQRLSESLCLLLRREQLEHEKVFFNLSLLRVLQGAQ